MGPYPSVEYLLLPVLRVAMLRAGEAMSAHQGGGPNLPHPLPSTNAGVSMSWIVLVFLLILLTPLDATAQQVVARMQMGRYTLSVISRGAHTQKCELKLLAEAYKFSRSITLKRSFYNCALYGAVRLTASDVSDEGAAFVFVEAARGGDGDHTGPVVEVFGLNPKGFKTIGEVELFDATYVREEGNISEVTGKLLFDFCDVCDGPEVSPHKVFVPVRVSVRPDGLTSRSTLDEEGKAAIRRKFEEVKRLALADVGKRRKYEEYVQGLEGKFRDLLAR